MALIRPLPDSIDKTYVFCGYNAITFSAGNNIPISLSVVDSNDVTISNNTITFNKAFSGTIKAAARITTGQTQDFALEVLKNGSAVLTGTAVSGYENVDISVSGSITASAGDTLQVCVVNTQYGASSNQTLDTHYVSII